MTYARCGKPAELVDLYGTTAILFDTLREAFDVPDSFPLPLGDVDGLTAGLGDTRMVAALAMLEAQTLRRAATPGVVTTNVVVVGAAAHLHRAIALLADALEHRDRVPQLLKIRDRVSEVGRVVAGISGPDGTGVVELA